MSGVSDKKMCWIAVIGIALILLFVGFRDMFKHKPGEGKNEVQVISQQIRGIGYFLLALVVLSLGSAVCVGLYHKDDLASMWTVS